MSDVCVRDPGQATYYPQAVSIADLCLMSVCATLVLPDHHLQAVSIVDLCVMPATMDLGMTTTMDDDGAMEQCLDEDNFCI